MARLHALRTAILILLVAWSCSAVPARPRRNVEDLPQPHDALPLYDETNHHGGDNSLYDTISDTNPGAEDDGSEIAGQDSQRLPSDPDQQQAGGTDRVQHGSADTTAIDPIDPDANSAPAGPDVSNSGSSQSNPDPAHREQSLPQTNQDSHNDQGGHDVDIAQGHVDTSETGGELHPAPTDDGDDGAADGADSTNHRHDETNQRRNSGEFETGFGNRTVYGQGWMLNTGLGNNDHSEPGSGHANRTSDHHNDEHESNLGDRTEGSGHTEHEEQTDESHSGDSSHEIIDNEGRTHASGNMNMSQQVSTVGTGHVEEHSGDHEETGTNVDRPIDKGTHNHSSHGNIDPEPIFPKHSNPASPSTYPTTTEFIPVIEPMETTPRLLSLPTPAQVETTSAQVEHHEGSSNEHETTASLLVPNQRVTPPQVEPTPAQVEHHEGSSNEHETSASSLIQTLPTPAHVEPTPAQVEHQEGSSIEHETPTSSLIQTLPTPAQVEHHEGNSIEHEMTASSLIPNERVTNNTGGAANNTNIANSTAAIFNSGELAKYECGESETESTDAESNEIDGHIEEHSLYQTINYTNTELANELSNANLHHILMIKHGDKIYRCKLRESSVIRETAMPSTISQGFIEHTVSPQSASSSSSAYEMPSPHVRLPIQSTRTPSNTLFYSESLISSSSLQSSFSSFDVSPDYSTVMSSESDWEDYSTASMFMSESSLDSFIQSFTETTITSKSRSALVTPIYSSSISDSVLSSKVVPIRVLDSEIMRHMEESSITEITPTLMGSVNSLKPTKSSPIYNTDVGVSDFTTSSIKSNNIYIESSADASLRGSTTSIPTAIYSKISSRGTESVNQHMSTSRSEPEFVPLRSSYSSILQIDYISTVWPISSTSAVMVASIASSISPTNVMTHTAEGILSSTTQTSAYISSVKEGSTTEPIATRVQVPDEVSTSYIATESVLVTTGFTSSVGGSTSSMQPMISETSTNRQPMVSETSTNRQPMISETSTNRQPMISETTTNRQPMISETSTNGQPMVSETSTNRQPMISETSTNRQPMVSETSTNRQPMVSETSTNRQPMVSETSTNRQPMISETSTNRQPMVSETSTNRQPMVSETSTNKQPMVSETSTNRKTTSTTAATRRSNGSSGANTTANPTHGANATSPAVRASSSPSVSTVNNTYATTPVPLFTPPRTSKKDRTMNGTLSTTPGSTKKTGTPKGSEKPENSTRRGTTVFQRSTTRTTATTRPAGSLPWVTSRRGTPRVTSRQTSRVTQAPVITTQPKMYVVFKMRMSWLEFCNASQHFIAYMREAIRLEKQEYIDIERIRISNMETQSCMDDDQLILVDVYIVDEHGKIDISLTMDAFTVMGKAFREESSPFKNRILNINIHDETGQIVKNTDSNNRPVKEEPGITMVIVIAAVGGCCCVVMIILQVMLRRRILAKKSRTYLGPRTSLRSLDHVALGVIPKSRPESGYWNPGLEEELPVSSKHSHLLNFAGLANFCMDNTTLYEEFQTIPSNNPDPSCLPIGEEDKNRFANVLPHKNTRVKLRMRDGDMSDYINADYVTGYKDAKRTYIATQSPLVNTVEDFWRMIWEQQSRVILMLNSQLPTGKPRQSTCYWPDDEISDNMRQYGDYIVHLKKKDIQQDYVDCTLEVMDIERNLKREVHHFWLTCWPDAQTPEPLSFVKFVLDTRPLYENSGAPAVVHCGPGTGRTGSLLAVDVCMRMFEDKRRVDILNCVYNMRKQRAGAVQSKEQYSLIYQALNEYAVILGSPSISTRSSVITLHAML